MADIQIFRNQEFGEVRTAEENGVVLFCGSDVARALGYTNPSKAVNDHCKSVVERRTNDSLGRRQNMAYIPEADLYRLVFRSKLPNAELFVDWVTSEVLPAIRRHGVYATPDTLEAMIADPDTTIRLLTALKEERAKSKELEAENERQRQAIEDFKPIAQYVDNILRSPGTMATTQIAADYDLSARKLNRILHEEGIQRNVNGQWILYRKHMGKGYTESITIPITHSDGRPDTRMHTRWTQKGRLLIHEILTSRGILAVMDRDSA